MPDKNNIEVVIVVSGQSERLKVDVHQTLEHLVHEALQKSGDQGQAPSEWELRTEDGRLSEQSVRARRRLGEGAGVDRQCRGAWHRQTGTL